MANGKADLIVWFHRRNLCVTSFCSTIHFKIPNMKLFRLFLPETLSLCFFVYSLLLAILLVAIVATFPIIIRWIDCMQSDEKCYLYSIIQKASVRYGKNDGEKTRNGKFCKLIWQAPIRFTFYKRIILWNGKSFSTIAFLFESNNFSTVKHISA